MAGINTALVYSLFYLLICIFVSRGIIPILLCTPDHEDQAIQSAAYKCQCYAIFSCSIYILSFVSIDFFKKTGSK